MKGMWRRIGWLVGALLLSFGILWLILRFQYFLEKCSIFEVLLDKEHLFHLSLAIIALPISIALWCFRTYDNKMSSFLQASSHLGGGNSEKRMAIIQLMLLKNKEQVFTQEIDRLTRGISLIGRNGDMVDLTNLNLDKINFSDANLLYVNFEGAELLGANFKKAKFAEIRLCKVNLRGADFSNAELHKINLAEANLRGADFSNAHLQNTNFSNADLRGAKFSKVNLQDATNWIDIKLEGAIYDDSTEFPPELSTKKKRDELGMIHKPSLS